MKTLRSGPQSRISLSVTDMTLKRSRNSGQRAICTVQYTLPPCKVRNDQTMILHKLSLAYRQIQELNLREADRTSKARGKSKHKKVGADRGCFLSTE